MSTHGLPITAPSPPSSETGSSSRPMYPRRINTRSALLDLIRQYEPVPRSQLAELANVSAPTVTNLVHELITQGIVREKGVDSHEKQGPGRPSQLLELVPTSRLALAVHLGATRPALALVDLRGQIVASEPLPQDWVLKPSLESTAKIAERAKAFLTRQRVHRKKLLGVGVGVPNIPPWDHQWIAHAFKGLAFPVLVDHNVRAMTLGEFVFCYKRQLSSMIFVNLGYGIGAGIVIHGRIWPGATGRAGELGHVRVTDENVPCRCGNIGCLESMAGERALVAKARALMPETRDITHDQVIDYIITSAQEGKPQIPDLLGEAGHYLGSALADLVNIVNPQVVVFGGRLAGTGRALFDPIHKAVYARSQSGAAERVDFRPSQLGEQVALVGSGALVLMDCFYAPRPTNHFQDAG